MSAKTPSQVLQAAQGRIAFRDLVLMLHLSCLSRNWKTASFGLA